MNVNACLWKAAINILFIAHYSKDTLGALIITNDNQFFESKDRNHRCEHSFFSIFSFNSVIVVKNIVRL